MKSQTLALFILLIFTVNISVGQDTSPPTEEPAPEFDPNFPPVDLALPPPPPTTPTPPAQDKKTEVAPAALPPVAEPLPAPVPVPTENVQPGRDPGNVTMRPTLTFDGVTYGHPEKGLVNFAWSGVGYDPDRTHRMVDELYALNPPKPPLHWQSHFNTLATGSLSVECLWRLSGKYEDVERAVESQDPDAPASWYWVEGLADPQPLNIDIRLYPNGSGAMSFMKGERCVARTRCLTSNKAEKQLPEGDYPVLEKAKLTNGEGIPYKDSGEVVGARMYYPLRLQDSTGKYLHAGNGAIDQADTARGCVRGPGVILRLTYDSLVVNKSVVSITHSK